MHDQYRKTSEVSDSKVSDQQAHGYTQSQKSKILFASLSALCIGNMMMLNVAVFLPKYIEDRNQANDWTYTPGAEGDKGELNAQDSSLIIAIFFIAQILNAPFNSKIKNYLGSKNAILFGFAELIITTFGLGAISACENP